MSNTNTSDIPLSSPAGNAPLSRAARWAVLVAAFAGLLFDGIELGLMPVASLSVSRSLLGEQFTDTLAGDWFARFTASLMLGAAVGGIVLGSLGDRIGRTRAMGVSVLFYSVFAGLGAFVQTQEPDAGAAIFRRAGRGWHVAQRCRVGFRVLAEHLAPGGGRRDGCRPQRRASCCCRNWRGSGRSRPIPGAGSSNWPPFRRCWASSCSSRCRSRRSGWPAVAADARRSRPLPIPSRRRLATLRDLFRPPLLRLTLVGIVLASIPLVGAWAASKWMIPWADKLASATHPGYKAVVQGWWALGATLGSFVGAQVAAWLGRRLSYFLISLGTTALTIAMFQLTAPLRTGVLAGGVRAGFRGDVVLRLAAALSAGVVPDARPGHGQRPGHELRPVCHGRRRVRLRHAVRGAWAAAIRWSARSAR